MKKAFILFSAAVGFILVSASFCLGGDGTTGFKVYSESGSHNTGDFIPASDGDVTIISQPEKSSVAEEKPLVKQDDEKIPEEKQTIEINDRQKDTQNNQVFYPRKRPRIKN